MELPNNTLWQIGAGDTERKYDDICIEYDVMLIGPGSPGTFDDNEYASQGDIRRFYREAKKGDIVLLRLGTGDIKAVGEIADDQAQWLSAFGDVDGWDLQHVRRVRWFNNTSRLFPVNTLGGRVSPFKRVSVKVIREWVQGLQIADDERARDLNPLPSDGKELTLEELGQRLFIEGLPSEYVDKLMNTFTSIQRVASWYSNKTKKPQGRPSEQETVCYLVVPLLFSLGWSQQTAAIQWNYVDVALFSSMPPTASSLAYVIEVKSLDRSVFNAVGQAREYALQSGREQCQKLVVTDGIRYALYHREGGDFRLSSYLNVLYPRDSYEILKNCRGAVDTLLGMARLQI